MSLMACNDDEEENIVSTVNYKLPEGCDWNYDLLKIGKLYRVDNREEFISLNLADCEEIDIDFERHTLLYYWFLTKPLRSITTKLFQTHSAPNLYYLKTEIETYLIVDEEPAQVIRHVALIVNKLDSDASIELSVVEK